MRDERGIGKVGEAEGGGEVMRECGDFDAHRFEAGAGDGDIRWIEIRRDEPAVGGDSAEDRSAVASAAERAIDEGLAGLRREDAEDGIEEDGNVAHIAGFHGRSAL